MTRGPIIDQAELDRRFDYHQPDAGGVATHTLLRSELKRAAEVVVCNTPPSREQSLALTKLEEAMFWANAALARSSPP